MNICKKGFWRMLGKRWQLSKKEWVIIQINAPYEAQRAPQVVRQLANTPAAGRTHAIEGSPGRLIALLSLPIAHCPP